MAFSAFQINAFQNNAFEIAKSVVKTFIGGAGKDKFRNPVKQPRRFFIENNGQILIFANAQQAEAWTQANNQLKQSKKRKKISLPIAEPLEKIDLTKVKEVAEQYGKATSVKSLLESQNYAKIVVLYENIIQQDFYLQSLRRKIEEQEEEDLAILLMAL